MDCKNAIIGLGNPGPKYETTRHNVGFMLVDHLLAMAGERKSMHLERVEESGDYELWRLKFAGAYRLLAKPMTYMNLSGKAVARICGRHGLTPDQTLVVHDELDLALGRLKLKKGGGNNGHNGLKSIEEHLGTPEFFRLRVGIGRPATRFADVSAWVLEPFAETDAAHLPAIMTHAIKGIDIFYRRGLSFAVQHVNGYSLDTADDESTGPA
ncbi:MAG: aminoacyl-tRNA hydrolase [Pseudomonadota bacterium]